MEQIEEFPTKPINVHDYEALARSRLDANAWGFYYGGSDDEVTLRANCAAFERIRLRPRVLVDVSTCDLHTLGPCRRLSMLLLDVVRSTLMEGYGAAQIF